LYESGQLKLILTLKKLRLIKLNNEKIEYSNLKEILNSLNALMLKKK